VAVSTRTDHLARTPSARGPTCWRVAPYSRGLLERLYEKRRGSATIVGTSAPLLPFVRLVSSGASAAVPYGAVRAATMKPSGVCRRTVGC